ncbi:MAG: hypothetical protein OR995_02000 [Candidatus Nanopelagicales bacterium]|nr:hypothetical protein [Candidatus Nanopelagicales bacterium]
MNAPAEQVMNPNADSALRRPYALVLTLAAIAGAMDALDFRVYGVFTANQAGNLVLLWERMQDNPGEATLSLFSLAGCAIGVMIVIVLRFRFAFFVTPSGSRTLLYMAAVFLAVTAFTGVSLTEPIKGVETGKFPIGSSSWWAGAVSVGSSAMALAVLGTIFVMVGRYKANVISSTGPFIDSIRFAVAGLMDRTGNWPLALKAVVAFPVAWSLGAAIASFVPLNRGILATFCALVVCLAAFLSRRVGDS